MIEHDPLCDAAWDHHFTDEQPCGICIAVAKAREDERAVAVQRVEALHIDGAVWLLRHEVIAAIKGEQP